MFLLALLVVIVFVASTAEATSFHGYPYLYAKDGNLTASFPIHDHIAPENERKRRHQQPDFLYSPSNDTYRVVEFYVHWCGICRHYSTHYVNMARKLSKLTADSSVNVEFHAVSCVPNRMLCLNQKVPGYPLVRLFKPGATDGFDLKHTDAKMTTILSHFGIKVDNVEDIVEEEDWTVSTPNVASEQTSFWTSWLSSGEAGAAVVAKRSRDDLKNDIHLSFDFTMRNGVFMTNEDDKLSESTKSALFQFISLLHKTTPAVWGDFHSLLHSLLLNFKYIVRKESYLVKYLDKHRPQGRMEDGEAIWSQSCSLGEPGRGYTCGLWEMFHAMSVGVVSYNLEQINEDFLVPTEKAAENIRNFIDHFFQCSECRENFLQMYDTCGHDRCTRLKSTAKLGTKVTETVEDQITEWQQLSLWLLDVHNGVNVRLMREKASRQKREASEEEVVAAQWPAVNECQSCWITEDKNKKLNETVVVQYLALEYGKRDHSLDDFQRSIEKSIPTQPIKVANHDSHQEILSASCVVLIAALLTIASKTRRLIIISMVSRLWGKARKM